jgi:DNA-binding CsgD family transcriptional regulator
LQMEKITMRSSQALVAMEFPTELTLTRVDEVVRTLVELVGKEGDVHALEHGKDASSEEVLVDTEIHGSRYLLVRMPKPNSTRIRLSPREQEIVRMVAKGHPNKVIADVLNISSWTVCTHLRRIFAKLGVGSRAAMVAQLMEPGGLASEHHGPMSTK